MTETTWLIDKSALARIAATPEAEAWARRIERGLVQIATATILEIGFSAQSTSDWTDRIERPPASLMPLASVTPAIERRAVSPGRKSSAFAYPAEA